MDDDSTIVQDDINSFLNHLPTELLVEIFSYLPLCDKIKMQYVSPRFKHIMEVPSLWKDFVWPYYEPLQVCSVSKILKAQGEHVRRIFFPFHVKSANTLKMAQYCTKVTHLSLPRDLSLDHLEEILHTMKHLQQLDVFVNIAHMESRLLATAAGVKQLILRYENTAFGLESLLEGIKQQGHSLPSVINVYVDSIHSEDENMLLQFWSTWSSKLPSFKVGLYDDKKIVPMNLYPSIPLMQVEFGQVATPPLIKLIDHGILGLQYDTFYFTDYDHYGEVRHSITAQHYGLHAVKEHCISNLYSVSNINFSRMDICPGHLEQLAIACPNLERINLMNAKNCLRSLKGLQALVDKCQNLQGINLAGIPAVECQLLLWELLSSFKKLTHLAIDLSMLTHHGYCDDVDQQKLIGLFKSCSNLKALEVTDKRYVVDTKGCLLSHFPSLVYINLVNLQHTGSLEHTITNCHQLKYLYNYSWTLSIHHISLPSPSSCHLQQLYIDGIDLCDSVHVLSAHGGLEQVILSCVRITINDIATLISNSPNLILLDITLAHDDTLDMVDYKKTISEKFSYHKLFTVGDFNTGTSYRYSCRYHRSHLTSLWSRY